jgi:hypothetical protein
MRRLCVAVAIPWLLVTVVAVGHGQEVPDSPRVSQGEIRIRSGAVKKIDARKLPPGEATSGGDTQGAPAWMTYSFFFKHLENLDRVADQKEALGNESSAAAWRTHEQLAAGLDAEEAGMLKEVAHDCNQAVEEKDAEIRAMATALHARQSGEALVTAAAPPDLDALWQERIEIVDQQVHRLRALLGEERFLSLDSYVRTSFAPVVVPAGSTKGESR